MTFYILYYTAVLVLPLTNFLAHQSYVEIYQQDTLPEPMTMLRATAEANNLSALASAQEKYVENMDKVRIVLFFFTS